LLIYFKRSSSVFERDFSQKSELVREDSFALSFVSWRLAGGDLPAWQAQLTRVLSKNTGGQLWLSARDSKKLEF